MNRHGTWRQAITSLLMSVLLLLMLRWVAVEPYVIPSGSMLPTLKVLDFIYVNKFAYGLRIPFSSAWLFERALPKRCDIVVFRSQTDPDSFLIKRVIGLPGERIELLESGRIRVNDKVLETKQLEDDGHYTRYSESCVSVAGDVPGRHHVIQLSNLYKTLEVDPVIYAIVVPENHLAMFGDNRHESADSRVWGTLPRTELLGEARGIWLSCENALPGLPRLCDPSSVRFHRMFHGLDNP